MKQLLLISSVLAVLTACGANVENNVADNGADAAAYLGDCQGATGVTPALNALDRDEWGTAGLDLEAMDKRFAAGDDFFCHVNGLWYSNFDMPEDKTRFGAFTLLRDKSEARVKVIIDELAAAQPDIATIEGKVAAYYNAYLNTDAIETAGMMPVQPYLDQINAMTTVEDLAMVFAGNGFSSPVGGWVDVDSLDTENYIFYLTQGGLGLPDRDMYLNDEGKNIETREGYLSYLTLLLGEAGYADSAEAAARVMALETEIAKVHWDRTVGRNRNLTYNKMSKADLIVLGGEFPVEIMLKELKLSGQDEFVVRQVTPDAEEIAELGLTEEQVAKISGGGIAGLMSLMASADLNDWKAYLTAHFLSDFSSVLPEKIDQASFAFYSKQLSGQEQQRPRWKRAVGAVEGALGEAVGKVYAERYFPTENKVAMDELVSNLRRAMADNLNDLDWMGAETKVEARDKLAKFTPKIGYTEKFETYDSLTVGNSAFGNVMASGEWGYDDMIAQLGQPIDKTEWFMLPQTVNAYYSPNRNEIVFPAAILQPPFFNINADPAVNYGAIGGVIGHEIGHGFDDQGSKSDGDGVLRNWWTDKDNEAFVAKTDALVGQYDSFCPLDEGTACVNGRLGLGENTGDLGGLSMAFKAYKLSLDSNGDGQLSADEQAPIIDGYTGEQRFFMAWAQVWRAKYREEALRQQLIRGPHSPPYYRVNGVVRNFDEWYEAFDIGPDHALYLPPEQRIRIW
ncbi:M13 family metallopeptidase [Porticoccaceae bacterium]|nr:M13 family metallopeptidase [Porticoccaceae bacterium]MDC0133927.1 M13 family metallopeptidase [Porticoccaceae bacterium]